MLDHLLGTADLLGHGDGLMSRAGRLTADIQNVRAVPGHHHPMRDGVSSVVDAVAAEGVGTHVDDAHHVGPPAPLEAVTGNVDSLHWPIMLPTYR